MVESAVFFIHTDGVTVNVMFLYVATGFRGIEKVAESSGFAVGVVSI